jgi:hypothetical protein
MRVSSENSRSPGLTDWPSLICTVRTVLDTCGRTSTVCIAVTVPLALTSSGTSPCWTRPWHRGTAALGGRLRREPVLPAKPAGDQHTSTAIGHPGRSAAAARAAAALQLPSTKPFGWSIPSVFIMRTLKCRTARSPGAGFLGRLCPRKPLLVPRLALPGKRVVLQAITASMGTDGWPAGRDGQNACISSKTLAEKPVRPLGNNAGKESAENSGVFPPIEAFERHFARAGTSTTASPARITPGAPRQVHARKAAARHVAHGVRSP